MQPGPRTVNVRREVVEAHTCACARNPYSIAIVQAIKRVSRHVLGERVGYENNHVLSVSTVTGGRRITDVVVQ